MTLEQLFPILMQYAPIMLDAIQNRGYDPGIIERDMNKTFNYWYGDNIYNRDNLDSYLSQPSDDPFELENQMFSIDHNFNQYLKDSDSPNNERMDRYDRSNIIVHDPEYSLNDLTPEYNFEDYFQRGNKNTPNALGYAKLMAQNGIFSGDIDPNSIDPSVKNPNALIQLYNKLNMNI